VGVREGEKKKECNSEERDIAHTSDSKRFVALDERKKSQSGFVSERVTWHIYSGRGGGAEAVVVV